MIDCKRCKRPMVEGFYCLSCGYVPEKGVRMYSIYRYFEHSEKELIAEGLTLDEVKEHCSNILTSGFDPIKQERWFDGFVAE